MSTKKTDDLPDFKDQCRSGSVAGDPPARRIVVSARHTAPSPPPQVASNKEGPRVIGQARPFGQSENVQDPTAVETMIAEAVQIPATVEAIPLSDEESQTQVPLPQDETVVRQKQAETIGNAIDSVVRRYAAYLLLLIVVLIAAGVVGGVCSTGKCSSSGSAGETPGTAGQSPNSTITADRAAAIAAFINNITLTNKTIAYPPISGTVSATSTEEHALQWLIESDPLKLTVSDQLQLQQRYALAAWWFKSTASYNVWKEPAAWLTGEKECDWFGITCFEQVDIILAIELPSNNIGGGIPEDLGLLQNLKAINLYSNSLSGSLPESIGQWSDLERFLAGNNTLNGTLPDSIGDWSKVVHFDVSINAFTGTIPKAVENWSHIQYAYFVDNAFTGSISSGICDAVNLTILNVDCPEVNCTCCNQVCH
jgi:hypothetical protein